MIKKILLKSILSLALFNSVAFSHPGGHGPVSEKEAIFIASSVAIQFIDFDAGLGFGKLKKSWRNIPENDKKIHTKGTHYYIVSILNSAENKTLYFLLSDSGEIFDANFSGVFPNLKN